MDPGKYKHITHNLYAALLKTLLPHEYNEYHIQHGARVNSQLTEQGEVLSVTRGNAEHRGVRVSRGVIGAAAIGGPAT